MKFEPGDIVANPFGHVMVVGRWFKEYEKWSCFYETSPSAYHLYGEGELKLLSKTKGVDMSLWNSTEFAEVIRKSKEWATLGRVAPRKYRRDEQIGYKRPEPQTKMSSTEAEEVLKSFSKEELRELLKELKK